jgi:type I restriction enzyme S subunit
MSSEWKSSTIGELCNQLGAELQTGPFGSQLHSYDYQDEGVPVVPTEAINDGRINPEVLPVISIDKAIELSRHILRSGDILFARRGAQATGKTALVRICDEGAICGTGAIRLRIGDTSSLTPAFLAAYLSGKDTVAWIRHHAIGATMPNLNESIIRSIPIHLPPLVEQKAIAHILGTLDDKIELIRKTNETLEAMAKALFQSWFVDFDPVRAKAEGRSTGLPEEISKLFPDSFEDSELGEIPRGWEVKALDEIAINPRETAKPGEMDSSDRYIGLEHMPRGSICLGESGEAEDLESNKNRFREGDVLFGKLRPYFKKTGYAQFDGVCSTDIVVARMRGESGAGFVCCLLASDPFVNFTVAASTGTRMPRTSWSDMCKFPFAIPTPPLLKEFDNQFCRLIERIKFGCDHSSHLVSIRDTLLPKLISGELRIPEAEKLVSDLG